MKLTICMVDNLLKHLKLNVFLDHTVGINCTDINYNTKPQITRATRGVVRDY